jgi:hypothetical protein
MRTWLRSKVTLLFLALAVATFAVAGTAMALTSDPSGDTSGTTAASPTITSDKADYAPGELVTLTGSNWTPGESVNVVVNDDVGQTWNRNVNVTADASGNISDSFNLPDWFVATYSVKATGASGAVVTSSFTDAVPSTTAVTSSKNPSSLNESVTFRAKVTYSTTGAGGHTAGDPVDSDGQVKFGTGGNANCGGSFSKLQANQTPNANGEVTYTTSTLPAGDTTIRACFTNDGAGRTGAGPSDGSVTQTVNAVTTTNLTFDLSTLNKTFGDPSFSVASLATSNSPATKTFALGSGSVGCTVTNAGQVTITGAAVGTDKCVIEVSQAATANYLAGGPVPDSFNIAKANQTITFGTIANKVVGTNFTVSATASSGLPVSFSASGSCTVSGNTVSVTGVGPCTITASQAGNGNYNAATPVPQTFNGTYTFTGFSSPVDNKDLNGNWILNTAKAGQAIPLKWRITDANGSPITNLAPESVKVTVANYSCGLSETTDQLEEYAANSSGLQNLGSGYYQFTWKSPHQAQFKFTK